MRVNARPITKPILILLENQENHYAQDLDSILVVDISEQKSFADLFFIIFIVKIVGNLDVNWIQYNTINFPDLPFSLSWPIKKQVYSKILLNKTLKILFKSIDIFLPSCIYLIRDPSIYFPFYTQIYKFNGLSTGRIYNPLP